MLSAGNSLSSIIWLFLLSKRVFDIQFPFLIKTSINSPRENRYWAQLYDVDGTNYRVTSEWFENKSRDKFLMFLKNQDIGCLS